MDIKIKRIKLTNFKCFRDKEFAFGANITTIAGRNGVGKTTIADAILWCLFGKNSQGQADFDIKTHDADGRPIPHLDHAVEMELAVVPDGSQSGKTVTLRRTLKETWIKKRGSEEQVFKNNTTEYMINGEVTTATDYRKYISEMVSEDVFRAITNPSYFPSLKWQQQREFLSNLAGDITPDTSDAEFAELLKHLNDNDEDIIAYRKHLSYQIKQVKDKLDKIPVRLEEQNKALPIRLDWDALRAKQIEQTEQMNAIDAKILNLHCGNADDVSKAKVREEIDQQHKLKHSIEESVMALVQATKVCCKDHVDNLSRKFNNLLSDQRDLEAAIKSYEKVIERCRETLEQCEKDAEAVRREWNDNQARTLEWGESDDYCPTCLQRLPEDQLQEKKAQAIANFNKAKADVKAALTARADKIKSLRAEANDQIASYEKEQKSKGEMLEETKKSINKVFSEKQQAERELENVKSYESVLADDEEYKECNERIKELEEALTNTSVSSDEAKQQLAELEAEKSALEAQIAPVNAQLMTKPQYERIMALIDGINIEQAELIRQLSSLERMEDVAIRYQDRQTTILESRINEHFKLVQWRMFRTVNNGGDPFREPFCECYVDGVAYHDGLNQAARLNAGLDIINALCNHYQVSAPIVIDNSESNLNILDTVSQQIRLEVADKDLQII